MTRSQRQTVRKVGFAVLYTCIGIATVLLMYVTVTTHGLTAQIRNTQKSTTKTVTNSASTLHVIQDCTQPTGVCYADGQQRTKDAVDAISRATTSASIYAAYCAHQDLHQSVADIEACVRQQFNAEKSKG